jgi:Flp pilus assembly protein TadD
MNPTASTDDAHGLLLAALAADAEGDADRSLALLRQSVEAQPVNPYAHHLIGAELAARGAHGDAVLHLTTAIEQGPQMHEARLQLGLLWLTLGNLATASTVLQPLLALPADNGLHHFGLALCELAAGDPVAARASLRRGLEAGTANAPLMGDMTMLLRRLEQEVPGADTEEALRSVQHGMAISAYAGGTTDR